MTPTVSFFPTTSPANSGEAIISAPAAGKNSADAPFSRVLDRAVRETPNRKNNKSAATERPAPKESKSAAPDKTAAAETNLESTPRPPRVKNSKRDREDSENPACASNTAAPTTPTPPPEQPVCTKEKSTPETVEATAIEGQSAEGETATPGSTSLLTTATETSESSGLDLASLITTPEATNAEAVSLLNTITPTATKEVSGAALNTPEPTASELPALPVSDSLAPVTTEAEISLDPTQLSAPLSSLENLVPPTTTPLAATSAKSAAVAVSGNTSEVSPTTATMTVAAATGATDAPDTTPEELRRSVRAARRARLEALETPAGTGGAKSSETMKTVIKKEELAGSAEQFLPVSSPQALSALRNLPGELNRKVGAALTGSEALEAAAKTSAGVAHGDTPAARIPRFCPSAPLIR
ncbi:MAG: hypothetical protein QM813_23480 [Verrucomicrobiota bacterium]